MYVVVNGVGMSSVWCMIVGIVSMLYGGLMVMGTLDVKRCIAYSTMVNMGLCLVCVGGSVVSLHVVSHGLVKSLLFMCVGGVMHGCLSQDRRGV